MTNPARPFIPYGRQHITDEDIAAVTAVLRSDFLTQGPAIAAFEQSICEATGAKYAVAVANATGGLHIACMALGLKPGGLLWTSPVTFVASANCARYVGADVDFVDTDPATFNLSMDALEAKLKTAARLPDIVVPVHLSGVPCDMERLAQLAQQYGFKVMEDAAHAVGASHRGLPVGAGRDSDCAVFSFHPVKIVTTGEGGVITTNDEALAKHLRRLRTHGITREAAELEQESHGGWYYEMQELAPHYRMTDIQAALGASQMQRLSQNIARRTEIAARYRRHFANTAVGFQQVPEGSAPSYHLFPVQVDAAHKKAIFDGMRAAHIGVNLHYMPVYLQPYYQRLGFKPGHCPNAETYYARAMSLPMFPELTDADVDYVAETLLKLVAQHAEKEAA